MSKPRDPLPHPFADVNGDGILDRISPISHSINEIPLPVPTGSLGWLLKVDDATLAWSLEPQGSLLLGLGIFLLLLLAPAASGFLAVYLFRAAFYRVHVVVTPSSGKLLPDTTARPLGRRLAIARAVAATWPPRWRGAPGAAHAAEDGSAPAPTPAPGQAGRIVHSLANRRAIPPTSAPAPTPTQPEDAYILNGMLRVVADGAAWEDDAAPRAPTRRKRVLMASLEYEIPDWKVRVRIGGMGVITSLTFHVDADYYWVVPKISGVQYGECEELPAITVEILGLQYGVRLYAHTHRNVVFLLLECGPFYGVSATNPYPARMDDLESAVFYSTWNQCIAELLRRYPVDVYHMNDFHGALAPLYLLPQTVPVFLSLHNSEFQGLWPLRHGGEKRSVCSVFNLPLEVCEAYVQFGSSFNLLHAAAMYVARFQAGYGVIGVSDRYADRCFRKYPCLWSLQGVMALPNPNPADRQLGPGEAAPASPMQLPSASESKAMLQSWAGLAVAADACILLFVVWAG
jgi:alpha-1,3-glucan synthase